MNITRIEIELTYVFLDGDEILKLLFEIYTEVGQNYI